MNNNYVEVFYSKKNKTRRLVLVQGNHYNFLTQAMMVADGVIKEDEAEWFPTPFQFLGEYDASKGLDYYQKKADKRFKKYEWLDAIDYTGNEYTVAD